MESAESCFGGENPPKGNKKGVRACKDKSKTKKISQNSFGTKSKYGVPPVSKKPDPIPTGSLHDNMSLRNNTDGDYKPSGQAGGTVPVNVNSAIKIEKANTKNRKDLEKRNKRKKMFGDLKNKLSLNNKVSE